MNNYNNFAPSVRTSVGTTQKKLSFLILELTQTCNLKCPHCYSNSTPQIPIKGKMELQDWKNVIVESFEEGCRKIQFIGGEVTIHPNLSELIYYADSLGYSFIEVYTNGTNLNNQLKETFLNKNVNLAFSIYSDQPTIHDTITNRKGSFQKTVDSIVWAIQCGLEIRVGVVEMEANVGTIERTTSFLNDLGVVNIEVDHVRGIGRGKNGNKFSTHLDELCGKCTNGGLCVTSSGKAYPCVFSRFWPLGDIKDGIKNIYNGSQFYNFKKELTKRKTMQQQVESDCLLHYS